MSDSISQQLDQALENLDKGWAQDDVIRTIISVLQSLVNTVDAKFKLSDKQVKSIADKIPEPAPEPEPSAPAESSDDEAPVEDSEPAKPADLT